MNMNNTTEEDVNQYFKSKRYQYVVEIRKKKNEDFIQQKRNKLTSSPGGNEKDPVFQQTRLWTLQQFNELTTSFFNALKANDYDQLANAASLIRRAISNDENPPLDHLISTGVVPHIVKLLGYETFEQEKLMIECAWVIANVASGTTGHVNYLIDLNIVQKALDLLDHPNEDVKDNAIWMLANVAGDSFENRDKVLEAGIVPKLVNTLNDASYPTTFISHVSWLISNLTRGKPYPPFSEVEPLLKIIRCFILNVRHEEVLNNCMWSLSYFSDGDDKHITAVLDLGVCPYIIEMMGSDKPHNIAPALRTAGNLLTGKEDTLTNIMIEQGVIPPLAKLLNDPRKLFRKEACWAVSNILAGTPFQVDQIFNYNNREIIRTLIHMACNDIPDIAKECIFCLTNACSEGSLQHIKILVEYDIIEMLVETIKNNNDSSILKICLEAIGNILYHGKQAYAGRTERNPYVLRLAQCEGFGVIEILQSHPDNDVYGVVAKLIENYLEYELA